MNKRNVFFYWTGALQLFIAIGAVVGGMGFIVQTDGSNLGLSIELLHESPFDDFLIPGLVLFVIHGVGSVLGSMLSFNRHRLAGKMSILLGVAMVIWISCQVYWIGLVSWLQPVFFVLGIIEGILGVIIGRRS